MDVTTVSPEWCVAFAGTPSLVQSVRQTFQVTSETAAVCMWNQTQTAPTRPTCSEAGPGSPKVTARMRQQEQAPSVRRLAWRALSPPHRYRRVRLSYPCPWVRMWVGGLDTFPRAEAEGCFVGTLIQCVVAGRSGVEFSKKSLPQRWCFGRRAGIEAPYRLGVRGWKCLASSWAALVRFSWTSSSPYRRPGFQFGFPWARLRRPPCCCWRVERSRAARACFRSHTGNRAPSRCSGHPRSRKRMGSAGSTCLQSGISDAPGFDSTCSGEVWFHL